jgi:hypothetical protein
VALDIELLGSAVSRPHAVSAQITIRIRCKCFSLLFGVYKYRDWLCS